MTSENPTGERGADAYVWVWMPGRTDPVVAGALHRTGDVLSFNYGRSYLTRDDAVALYLPELSLQRGPQRPPPGMSEPGCIRDGAPDAWGQRVVQHLLAARGVYEVDLVSYLLESGSNRIGALDFQASATQYVPRGNDAKLEELLRAAATLDAGDQLPDGLDQALLHGSSIGGARPKALFSHGGRQLVAKFTSTSDTYPVVKAEAAAMLLAARAGLDVAPVQVVQVLGRDVLLVDRFDRPGDGTRAMMVSALTIAGLDEMMGRYATYHDLAETVRHRFAEPEATCHELFARIVCNILVGNTDDHARNHAAFWDGTQLSLTPAYDICPQARSTGEATQTMAYGRDGQASANLRRLVNHGGTYLLTPAQAVAIVDRVRTVVHDDFDDVADEVGLTTTQRKGLWGRQFANPSIEYPT